MSLEKIMGAKRFARISEVELDGITFRKHYAAAWTQSGHYVVIYYNNSALPFTCDCEDRHYRRVFCKHAGRLAIELKRRDLKTYLKFLLSLREWYADELRKKSG